MKNLTEVVEFCFGYSVPLTGLALGITNGICRAKNIDLGDTNKIITLITPTLYGAIAGVTAGTIDHFSKKKTLEENSTVLSQITNGTTIGLITTGIGYGLGSLIG